MKVAEVVQKYWGGRAARAYDTMHYIDNEKMKRALLTHLNVDKNSIILDFGTGPGSLALTLAEMGYSRIIGLDINESMLNVAKEKLQNYSVKLLRGDGLHLPIADNSVDAVVSKWVLWVMPDPQKAVEEMIRVTKPGGQVIAFSSGRVSPEKNRSLLKKIFTFPIQNFHLIYITLRFRIPLLRTKEFWQKTKGKLPMYSLKEYAEIFRQKGLTSVEMTKKEEYGTLGAKLFFGGFKFSVIKGTKPKTSDMHTQFPDSSDWNINELLPILVCPVCRSKIVMRNVNELVCEECHKTYPIVQDIPYLLPDMGKLL